MKKLFIILSIILFLQEQPTTHQPGKELDVITTVFTEEGFTVEEWDIIMINKMSRKKFNKIKNKLQNSYLGTVIKEESKLIYISESKNTDDKLRYTTQIIIPENQNDEITFQIVVSGKEWDSFAENYYNNMTKHLKNEFSLKFNKIFTCVKLTDNGIIDNGYSYDEIWQKMNVVHKNEHYDNVKQSNYEKEVYGYTPMWNSKVIVQDEPINFHMILKNNKQNNKTVIIGTPIILNEY